MGEIKSSISAEDALPHLRSVKSPVPLRPWNGRDPGFKLEAPLPAQQAIARPRWPTSRIAAVEALWGDGFTTPGGAPETLRLVKPLGLSSSVTLMLLGGGLGGAAESICSTFGTWVASFEADDDLRQLSKARQATRPKDELSRITIDGFSRTDPNFRQTGVHHAVALEALRGARPMPLLESLAATLAPKGQIVLTELVSDKAPNERDREFAAWCRLDNRLPELPSSEDVTQGLERLHFDVRVVEDLSDRHIAQTLGGWREAVRAMASGPRPSNQMAATFVTEAELWLLRIRLMRRLGVRLMRWYAIGA